MTSDAQALEQALNLAANNPLPLTARSLTAEEIVAIDRRINPIVFGLYGVGVVGILLFAWFGTEAGDGAVFPIAAIVAMVLLVPLWLFARFRAGRRKDYRDPLVSIEAGEEGITVRRAGRVTGIGYRDVVLAGFILLPGAKSRVLFLGVTLDSAEGPLMLENMAYASGTITAAAIVARCHALGLPVPRRAE